MGAHRKGAAPRPYPAPPRRSRPGPPAPAGLTDTAPPPLGETALETACPASPEAAPEAGGPTAPGAGASAALTATGRGGRSTARHVAGYTDGDVAGATAGHVAGHAGRSAGGRVAGSMSGHAGADVAGSPGEAPGGGAGRAARHAGGVTAARPGSTGRDRYFDTLRAVALVRVVFYHTFGWAWCGMVFPSMGVMFALAGTLMAKSLRRPAFTVVKSRLRRLLPPFWFWGVFVVLAMLVHGWMPGWQIVYWVVPLGDPPGSAWGEQAWEILWYLRTYLWFVLLSPALLWIFRKAPVPVLLLSLAPVLVLNFVWSGPDDRLGSALWDLSTYLFCWILGFAHREGVLRRAAPAAVLLFSLAATAYGGWYALTHQAEFGTYDLDENPLAQAFWSAGFVMLLMWAKERFRIDFARPARFRWLDRTVTVFNARAVTIYLWHEIALVLAVPLIDRFWDVPAFERYLPLDSQWFLFGVAWLLIAAFVLSCGWVEDLAAGKPPRLLP